MRPFNKVLQLLQESQYLQTVLSDNGESVVFAKLLKHGLIFQRQLRKQLQNSSPESAQYITRKTCHPVHNHKGLSFLFSEEFRRNYENLCRSINLQTGFALFKTLEESRITSNEDTHIDIKGGDSRLTLVSDYFVHASRKLETFYNIQRERKIWWMRYSADPSRYIVEPFDTELERDDDRLDPTFYKKCQSIKIKSVFPFSTLDMEHITLVPLNELKNYTNLPLSTALIRTTVNLDFTTYAMLLDGVEHDREDALLLHRQLAPFQCLLLQCMEKKHGEVDDLCRHIELVLRRAGLRVFYQSLHISSKENLNKELKNADNLGIGYTIQVNEDSLKTGLLSLRNRDTTLSETIHISDLPTYLVNIFTY